MTLIQSAVFAALGGYAGLSARIGARIYPDIAPQGVATPFAVWQEVSLVQANSMAGSAETSGLSNYTIQVTCWAKTGTLAREVDQEVRNAMIAASGFKSLLRDNRALGYEADTKLHGIQSDFSVWLKT